jgi:DNA-binding response OmpR family regulator
MRIAITDDHPDELAWTAGLLRDAGYDCSTFASGEDLIAALRRDTFDLLMLDWNMPRMSGLDVLAWLPSNLEVAPPVIVLTSRTAKEDIVRALEAGARDYIVKPEDAAVVRARVAAALRRLGPTKDNSQMRYGDYLVDNGAGQVSYCGEAIELRPKEFELARLLFENTDRPLSRSYLMQRVWKSSPDVETRTLDMHISRVRSKLGLDPDRGFALRTVFGFGYRLDNCAPPERDEQ